MYWNNTENSSLEFVNDTSNATVPAQNIFLLYENVAISTMSVIVCLVGICGNGLAIAALLEIRTNVSRCSFVYLLTLAISDTALLVTGLLMFTPRLTIIAIPATSVAFLQQTFQFLFYLSHLFVCISSLTVTIWSIERCVAVLWPFAFREFVFTQRPVNTTVVMIVVCLCVSTPLLLVANVNISATGILLMEEGPYIDRDSILIPLVRLMFDVTSNYLPLFITSIAMVGCIVGMRRTRPVIVSGAVNSECKVVRAVIIVAVSVPMQKAYSVFNGAYLLPSRFAKGADKLAYTLTNVEFLTFFLVAANDFIVYMFTHSMLQSKIRAYLCGMRRNDNI